MPRKKKEEVVETPVEMKEDAMNPSEEAEPIFKRVNSPTARVNCRATANGEILFTIDKNCKVSVLGEVELDGVRWTEIRGYIMSELLADI